MAKMNKNSEKRKKWLEERKNLSRVTRARVSKKTSQGSPRNIARSSTSTSAKSAQTALQTSKLKNSFKTKKHSVVTNGAKLKESAQKVKNVSETVTATVESDSTDKPPAKKSKVQYVDAVEKLENSSSIHVPKKLVLFVGNLPEDITKEALLSHFRRTGGVKSVKIAKHKGTETGKGYAYIEFNSTISHRLGLRLNNTTLAGRKIVVEFTSEGKMTEKKYHEKLKEKNDRDMKMPFDT